MKEKEFLESVKPVSKSTRAMKNLLQSLREEAKNRFGITIGKPPFEVYNFVRNIGGLPKFIKNLKEVSEKGKDQWHLTMDFESVTDFDFDFKITKDIPGTEISWKSLDGSPFETTGSIWFLEAPAGLGTVVTVAFDYALPGGKLEEMAESLKGESASVVVPANLRRLKAMIETGEVPTTEGQSSGRDEDLEANLKH